MSWDGLCIRQRHCKTSRRLAAPSPQHDFTILEILDILTKTWLSIKREAGNISPGFPQHARMYLRFHPHWCYLLFNARSSSLVFSLSAGVDRTEAGNVDHTREYLHFISPWCYLPPDPQFSLTNIFRYLHQELALIDRCAGKSDHSREYLQSSLHGATCSRISLRLLIPGIRTKSWR